MSRASPFPTTPRRPRSPTLTNGGPSQSHFPNTTRPLQISRPNTPSNVQRPRRSEDRPQPSEHFASSTPTSSRPDRRPRETITDATVHNNPQMARYRGHNGASSAANTTSSSTSRPDRTWATNYEETQVSPTALPAVLSAFQSAGRQRRRAMTNGSDDIEQERERRKEEEIQNIRQQRIREKIPGRRMNGKARAGDIDGALLFMTIQVMLPASAGLRGMCSVILVHFFSRSG